MSKYNRSFKFAVGRSGVPCFCRCCPKSRACRHTRNSKIQQFSEHLILFFLSFSCNLYKSCFQNGEVPAARYHVLLVAVCLSYTWMKESLSHGTVARKPWLAGRIPAVPQKIITQLNNSEECAVFRAIISPLFPLQIRKLQNIYWQLSTCF